MNKILPILFLFLAQSIFAQLTIRVTDVPASTPMDDNIYIAGDFQSWDETDTDYILDDLGDGTYEIELDIPAGTIQFKFTRGSWPTVEGDENALEIPNRTYDFAGGTETAEFQILTWKDLDGGGNTGTSTAAENVHILDDNFYMPQLDRNRRIWIYLPPDYEDSEKYYPVMYMHDGQNLFDATTSFSGEWEVDESLNELFEQGDHGCIVIGIENGGGLRIDELSPWYNMSYEAGGEGGQYVDFIVETLKPHVDANYRTLPGREHTVIFGSSLGGLISQYGIMEHQDVFGKAGVFSPAFWFNPEIFDHSADTPKEGFMKIYMLAGMQEDNGSVVDDVNQMESVLFGNGFTNEEFNKAFHNDGEHSEWYWAREFPWAYLWLFDGADFTAASEAEAEKIRVYPNPADSILNFDNLPELRRPVVRLFSMDGKLVKKEKLNGNSIDISDLKSGVYVLKIGAKYKFEFSQKVMIK